MSDKHYLTPDDFMFGLLGQAVDFDVSGLGTVAVRGLTVGEVSEIQRATRGNGTQLLAYTISLGMVEPHMTVEQLLAAPAGMATKYEEIGVRIAELSGLTDDKEQQDAFPGGGS